MLHTILLSTNGALARASDEDSETVKLTLPAYVSCLVVLEVVPNKYQKTTFRRVVQKQEYEIMPTR